MDLNVRRMAAGLMVLGAGSIMAPACADNESSLFIRAVQVPDDMCVFPAPGNDDVGLLNGRLDVRLRSTYVAAMIVGNQLVRRGDEEQIRTETSRIHLYAADVTVLDSGQAAIQRADGSEASFEVPVTGFVDPGSGSEPGYGTASALFIDSATADQLRAQIGAQGVADIIVSVILRGRTLGGSELESGEFQFPIQVCDGCLLTASVADDPASPARDCDNVMDLDDNLLCAPGQDDPVDCCRLGVAACATLP
jgi:hypothetical protein